MSEKQKSVPVARLVKLGTQAPTFDLPVSVFKLDGSRAELVLHCKAMRKTEWAAVRDRRQGQALQSALQSALSKAADPEGQPEPDAAEPLTAEAEAERAVAVAMAELAIQGHQPKVREGLSMDAETVCEFATGWDLEDPFTAGGLMALEDEFGGSLSRILGAYDLAIYQGRLGN
jgi:hypothetical protein